MEFELFIKYVQMINRFENISKEGNSIHLTSEEEDIAKQIKELANSNPKYKDLLKKIHSLPPVERQASVKEYFSNNTARKGRGINVSEVIAQTFGVNIDKIKHYYLSSGTELFSFYSDKLQKEIVLKNDEKGKSLSEYLSEIQNENEKYQTKDEFANTNEILMDERNKKNVELGFLTKEELESQKDVVDNLKEEEKRKLSYLMQNYERLGIKGINIDNMVFLDENDNVQETVIDSDHKVAIASPTELSSKDITKIEEEPVMIESTDYTETIDQPETETVDQPEEGPTNDEVEEMIDGEIEDVQSFEDLPDNVRAQIIFYYNNPEELEKIEDEQERKKWQDYIEVYANILEKTKNKPKVFMKNNINGFVDNALYISVAVGAVLFVAIIISLFYYYLY